MKRYDRLYGIVRAFCIVMMCMSMPDAGNVQAAGISGTGHVDHIVSYDYGTLAIEESSADADGIYVRLTMPDMCSDDVAGAPELPVSHIGFLVPTYSNNYRVRILSDRLEGKKELDHPVFPVQEPAYYSMSGQEAPFSGPDPEAYASRSEIEAQIVDDFYFEGWQHIVTVSLRPISYDHSESSISCHNDIRLRLEYDECTEDGLTDIPVFPPDPVYSPMLPQLVVNPPAAQQKVTSFDPLPVYKSVKDNYLIITTEDLKDDFEPLAIWKRQKGYDAKVVTIESVLNTPKYAISKANKIWDSAAALREYLKDRYTDIGHYFLLLAGDSRNGKIPVRKYHMGGSNNYGELTDSVVPSDVYFIDFSDRANNLSVYPNGIYSADISNPLTPSLPVGRLICSKKVEVSNYLRKLILYESWPGKGDMDYLDRGFVFTQNDGIYLTNISDPLSSYISFECMKDIDFMKPFEELRPTGAEIIQKIANVGFSSWRGHGFPTSVECSGNHKEYRTSTRYIQPMANTINNGHDSKEVSNSLDLMLNYDKPSVAYSISCTIMPFDYGAGVKCEYNMGSAFTVAGAFGGVALLGNTRNGYWGSSSRQEKIFGDIVKINRKLGIAELLMRLKSTSSYDNYEKRTHNLLGDPELELWLGKPNTSTLTISSNNEGYTVSGGNLQGCVISSYNGISTLRCDSVKMSVSKVSVPIEFRFGIPQDRLISVWKSGMLPVMRLLSDNTILSNVTKTYLMPYIDISATGSSKCKYRISKGAELNLTSVSYLVSDSSLSVSGGRLNLNGDSVQLKGYHEFKDGIVSINTKEFEVAGEISIENCELTVNCQ